MRTKVYVAGPISKGDIRQNIDQARAAGQQLLKAGFAPWVPQLTCYWGGDTPEVGPLGNSHQEWMEVDLPWVAAADAVLRLPGESAGADREVALANELGIPVYASAEDLIVRPPASGDDRFMRLLERVRHLHRKKAADYGAGEDPLANLRAAEGFGVPAWQGAMIRLNDKVHRLKSFCRNGRLANEGVEDTLLDLSAYALLAMILFQESQGK